MITIKKIIKAVLLVMIVFYVIMWWFSPYSSFLFPGGGFTESFIKVIYWGIVLLSGLIVGCTVYLAELIKKSNPKG